MSADKNIISKYFHSDKKDSVIDATSIISILKSKVRYQIIVHLLVYHELSLSQLSKLLNKSKPTLHNHLKKMIQAGIVKVSKEEKTRGSIKAKYYSLDHWFTLKGYRYASWESVESIEPERYLEVMQNIISIYRSHAYNLRNFFDMIDFYADHLEKEINSPGGDTLLPNFLRGYDFVGINIKHLSAKQYEAYMEYFIEFNKKIDKMILEDEKDRETSPEKPYFAFTVMLPLKKILELQK